MPGTTMYFDTACGDEIILEPGDTWEDCGCGNGTDCCGDRFCESCHDRDDSDYYGDDDYDPYGILQSYSYTPEPLIFYGGVEGTHGLPFYGMEIEITCNDRAAMQYAKKAFNERHGGRDNLVYLKSDGSVAGFEAVTHPMTYPWALENFPWDVLPELKARRCTIRPGDNGIHVHVSRSGFDSDAHAYRWFKLLYRNQDDVLRIARRSSNWAKFSTDHRKGQFAHLKAQKGMLSNPSIDRQIVAVQDRYQTALEALRREPQYAFRSALSSMSWTNEQYRLAEDYDRRSRRLRQALDQETTALARQRVEDTTRYDRYSAVNTGNDETFEVRLFASTLDPVTAQSTIGLVSATVEYTRNLHAEECIKGEGLKWPGLQKWLEGQPLYSAVRHADENCKDYTRARSTI